MNRFLSFIVGLMGLLLITPDLSAQNGYEVRGTVTDQTGQPVIGATVLEKGYFKAAEGSEPLISTIRQTGPPLSTATVVPPVLLNRSEKRSVTPTTTAAVRHTPNRQATKKVAIVFLL